MRKIERGYTPEESHEIFLNAYKYAKKMRAVKLVEQPKEAKSACEGCCFMVKGECEVHGVKEFDCVDTNIDPKQRKNLIYIKQ
jgi:hypothetical protein